jgi:type I restriction enzyme S subunit
MSLPQYKRYRQSGADWLGIIPDHWLAARVKTVFEIRKRIAGELGHDVLSVTQQGLKIRNTDSNDGQLSMDYSKYQLVEPDDFVMNHMDLLTGYVDVSKFHGVTSPDYRVFTARKKEVSLKFFLYLFQNGYQQRIFYAFGQGASGLGRWRMPTDSFNDFILPVPPLSEQTAIATFLEHETSKIDALVEEQRRLIELLREKRQAVISRAVTKGIDPNVAMKNSGVEWLGEVPEHWETTRIKHISAHVVDCLHTTPTYDGYVEYPAVRTADVERGRLLLEQARLVSRDVYEERIQRLAPAAGDILYSREGERFGMAALVPPDVDLCLGQRMMMFRVKPIAASGYVMWTLNSEPIYQQVMAGVAGATSPHVNISDVINFHMPSPPISEQLEIANFLEHETSRLDELIAEAKNGISLLQERRDALISAAVTGRIDVRGLVEAKAQVPDVVAA